MTFFILALAAGFILLLVVPHSKDRRQRFLQRGGSTALFAIGLVGSMYSLMTSMP